MPKRIFNSMLKRKKQPYKRINLPSKVIIGKKVLEKASEFIEGYNGILVVTGKKTEKIAGKKVSKVVDSERFIITEPRYSEVKKLISEVKAQEVDLIFACGGGKIIDVSKLAAFQAGIDFVSIPTNCSNDGISSPIASLYFNGHRQSLVAKPPIGVIADIKIIKKSPYRFIASGFGDAIAKYSAVRDWSLGHVIKGEYYGDYASSLSLMVAKMVMNNAYEIRKRTERGLNVLLEALISSGAAMGIAGSSRPASGSEHKFSHALDLILKKPNLHGLQVGLGTIVMSYLQGNNWEKVRNALEVAKCPTTAKKLGVTSSQVLEAMLKAKEIKPERYTIIEHLKLDRHTALKALESTGVI